MIFERLNRDLITLPVLNYHSGQHIKIGWTGSAAPLMINDVFKGDIALKDDLKSYFPDYYGAQITNDTMNLNNKLNGVWYGGVAGSTSNLPTGVKNALVRLLKYSSSAVFLEVIDMDTGVRHSNLWQATAGWFGWK